MKNATKKATKTPAQNAGKALAKAIEKAIAPAKKPAAKKAAEQPEPELGNAKGITVVSGTTGKTIAKVKAPKAAAKKEAKKPAAKAKKESKGATILALIARKGGATHAELMSAAGWQAHSVRGFLSTANKKGLAKITSAKNEAGERVYSAQ